MILLQRLYPFAAFVCGFAFNALTIGRKVSETDFWRLGAFLLGAAALGLWLAWRRAGALDEQPDGAASAVAAGLRARLHGLLAQAPYLLLQFFFGSVFAALFLLYSKSAGHWGAWLVAGALGALVVGNEFARDHYRHRLTLVWSLLALNAILLANFVLPHVMGSLEPRWFYLSTVSGVVLAHGLSLLAPRRVIDIRPAWALAGALMLAWLLGMIAPVPLVKRDLAVGQEFVQAEGAFRLAVEPAAAWQFWRSQAAIVHVPEGARLYAVSAVFAPRRVTAALEHRWERHGTGGWEVVYANRFETTGGRERGFRGYSWVLDPAPGEWRFTVATQDGRTISTLRFRVARGQAQGAQERVF